MTMLARAFARKPRESFGLDIGTSAVKVAQLRGGAERWTLAALASVPLRPDAIVGGAIKDPAAVAEAITEAVARAGITSTEATIGVAGRELITKKVQLPEVPNKELRDAVELEAEHHLPFELDEVFLDYHVAGRHDGVMDLLIVAVRKSKVNEYVGVVRDAGVQAVVVDVDGFALGNQFELNHPDASREAVALIDLGSTVMKTNIVHGGASVFARDIPFGGHHYTQAIANRLKTTVEHAERLKLGDANDVAWDAIVTPLEAVSRDLCLELRRTFDYYSSTVDSERIGHIVLSGGAARLRGLPEYLSSALGIPVEVARPLERIDVDAALAAEAAAAGPGLAVAIGLALRRPGDRGQ
jgi:type IV pilus assembly protein PilM